MPLRNPERFMNLLIYLSDVHERLDSGVDFSNNVMDPKVVLPSVGLMQTVLAELEEAMLEAMNGPAEPHSIALARQALLTFVAEIDDDSDTRARANDLIQALLDAAKYKAHRLTDERLDELTRPEEEGSPVPVIFAQFIQMPGIVS